MIGDWVYWKGKPVQIAEISGIKYSFGHIDVVLAHCNDDKILESHDIKSIKPIPITNEILEKNGFEKVENGGFSLYRKDENGHGMYHIYYHHHYYLDIDGYIRGIGTFEGVNIQHIHQLQQAMRLCGIEKEITLN